MKPRVEYDISSEIADQMKQNARKERLKIQNQLRKQKKLRARRKVERLNRRKGRR